MIPSARNAVAYHCNCRNTPACLLQEERKTLDDIKRLKASRSTVQQYNERIERLQSDDGLRQTIVKQLETVRHFEAVWVDLGACRRGWPVPVRPSPSRSRCQQPTQAGLLMLSAAVRGHVPPAGQIEWLHTRSSSHNEIVCVALTRCPCSLCTAVGLSL